MARSHIAPLLFVTFALGVGIVPARPAADSASERCTQLLRAIEGTDRFSCAAEELALWVGSRSIPVPRPANLFRAAEELALLPNHDDRTVRVLMNAVRQGAREGYGTFTSMRFTYALAATGRTGLPEVLKSVQEAQLTRERDLLLLVVGRMGSDAASAQPLLRKMLSHPSTDLLSTMRLRLALASIGDHSEALLKDVPRDLRDPGMRWDTQGMICLASREWITPDMIEPVMKILESEHRAYAFAAVLANASEKALPFVDRLEEVQKRAIAQQAPDAFIVTVALARIDPKRMERVFRRLMGQMELPTGHSEGTILWEFGYMVMDSATSRHVAGMLDDRDPRVVRNASRILFCVGLAGRDAFPIVLRCAQTGTDINLRIRAVQVLSQITPFTKLEQLEAAAREEKQPEVRDWMEAAVQNIRSLKSVRNMVIF